MAKSTARIHKKRAKKPNFPKWQRRRGMSEYNYGSLRCVGMPNSLVTYLRFDSIANIYTVPNVGPGSQPGTLDHIFGYNLVTPYNYIVGLGTKYADEQYFVSGAVQPIAPGNAAIQAQLNTWNAVEWYGNWYHRMRILKVDLKIVLRPIETADTGIVQAPPLMGNVFSTRDGFTVTAIDGKYVEGVMSPALLDTLSASQLKSTKGAKTYVISGQRDKALTIRRTIRCKDMLGIKDMMDQAGNACVISDTPNDASTLRNPDSQNQLFSYLKVFKDTESRRPVRYNLFYTATAQVQLYQRRLNNNKNLTTTIPPGPPG